MTPERWAKVQEAFERALEFPQETRTAYLDGACGSDQELRAEVEALIAADEHAGDFLDNVVRSTAADAAEHVAPPAEPAQPELATGARIGKYELQEYLGGGMSSVYRARDTVIDRAVVVKLLSQALARDENSRERFLREAKLLASVRHDHIVHIYDYGETDKDHPSPQRPFMVMEHLVGEDLASAIAHQRTGSLEQRVEIIRQAASALTHVHEFGIVHRDIKPANIHLEQGGRVKLMDFGIARTQVSSLTDTGAMLGTPHYISPEQLRGDSPTAACDIYSFGVVMYELLTGVRPYDGQTISRILYQIVNEPTPVEPLRQSGMDQHLVQLICRMMEKQPEARPRNFAEVVDGLDRSPPPAVATGLGRQWSLSWGFAPVVLLIAGASGWLWFHSESPPEAMEATIEAPSETPLQEPPTEVAAAPPADTNVEEHAAIVPAVVTAAPRATTPAPKSLPAPVDPEPAAPPPATVKREARPDPPPQDPPRQAVAAVAQPVVDPAAQAWSSVQSSQDPSAFETYLARFPNSPFADLAGVRLEELHWLQVRSSTDAAVLKDFLRRHPAGVHAGEAAAIVAGLEEQSASRAGILQTLRRYEAAHAAKNMAEIRAVRPGLGSAEVSQMTTSFSAARSIALELKPIGEPQIADGRATIICSRSLLFVDNRGMEHRTQDEITVRLRDTGSNWIIEELQ